MGAVERRVIRLPRPPSTGPLLLRAATIRPSRQAPALPDVEVTSDPVTVDREQLARYSRVCGFSLTNDLPPTYPHVLGFGLQLRLMTEPGFPAAPAGLVHLGVRIDQARAVDGGQALALATSARDLRPHPRGATLVLVCVARADGEEVWRSTSTYLAPGLRVPGEPPGRADRPAPLTGPPDAIWRVDAGTGRRYAAVSGDLNPIHLHPVTARAFGFPRAIAHGMWTAARALASLEGRLPQAISYDARFHRPLLLPATVALRAKEGGGSGLSWRLSVAPAQGDGEHLTATIGTPAGPAS